MKRSAKVEYACLAMLELASQYSSGQPVRIREIAQEHGIPSRFLVQILLQLKSAGYVVSTRGAAGGYRLAKAPEEITLGEVMTTIDGPSAVEAGPAAALESPAARALCGVLREVAEVERDMQIGRAHV